MKYEEIYISNKQENLFGRYITLDHILPILQKLNSDNQLQIIGRSVQDKPIYSYEIGTGKIKILVWSQMHGNESTTTKAVMDFLCFLNSDSELAIVFLKNYTFCVIPILNPDGATLYTRENANLKDLNRDFKEFSEAESKILMQKFYDFDPDYCFNMHDQRTIYGLGDAVKPATVSFLAPAFNENRDFNDNRTKAANVIVAVNQVLQNYIPNQVGKFNDSYNENCCGDSFQKLGKATILFEAGHFENDYEREITRKFIFIGLLSSCEFIYKNSVSENKLEEYLKIPENKVCYFDIIYKNVKIIDNYNNKSITFALNYKEKLENQNILFEAEVAQIENLEDYFGHYEFDAENKTLEIENLLINQLDKLANFKIANNLIINGKLTIL